MKFLWGEGGEVRKITVFWDMVPCSLVGTYQHFAGTCHFFLSSLAYSLTLKM
jgi:hypothetical protein